MKKELFIKDYVQIADIHASRLKLALTEIEKYVPFSAKKLDMLRADQVSFLDMMTTRFGKLQDVIGSKIFYIILNLLQEDADSFIDKLNKLEKLEYLDSKNWWVDLRDLRNQISHEYPNNKDELSANLNL